MYKIQYEDIVEALHDLNEYIARNWRDSENPQLGIGHYEDGSNKGLNTFEIPLQGVKGQLTFDSKKLADIAKIIPGAVYRGSPNADKTVVTHLIRFPIQFPQNAIPERYKKNRFSMGRNQGPPSLMVSFGMIITGVGVAGALAWAKMNGILLF